jgi:hypothetical protein
LTAGEEDVSSTAPVPLPPLWIGHPTERAMRRRHRLDDNTWMLTGFRIRRAEATSGYAGGPLDVFVTSHHLRRSCNRRSVPDLAGVTSQHKARMRSPFRKRLPMDVVGDFRCTAASLGSPGKFSWFFTSSEAERFPFMLRRPNQWHYRITPQSASREYSILS